MCNLIYSGLSFQGSVLYRKGKAQLFNSQGPFIQINLHSFWKPRKEVKVIAVVFIVTFSAEKQEKLISKLGLDLARIGTHLIGQISYG